MHYIRDVFTKTPTEHAHNKFVRYSKGEFVGPLMKVKFMSKNIKLYGSFHFVDELLMLLADYLGNKVIHVKGTLVWNEDLAPQLAKLGIKYSKVTKSRGIFKYVLDNDVHFKDFVETLSKFNLLVNIKTDEISLVTKTSFPKPNKEFSKDFCKATFPLELADRIKDEFFFDVKDKKIKEVEVKHSIVIDDIHLPKDYTDFEEARQNAKREGKVTREIELNKKETIKSETDILI